MTKRLIEFNCGDPKSNQQTASKVECQVTIHNHGDQSRPNQTRKVRSKSLGGVKLNESVEVFDSTAYCEDKRTTITVSPNIQEQSVEDMSDASIYDDTPINARNIGTINTRVAIPVKRITRNVPATTEQFLVVSSQPTVTAIEIEENIEFHKKRADILTHILCNDNVKLIANLIDASGKVILSQQDFCELVAVMLSTNEHTYEPSQIRLELREEVISSCLKVQISPFKAIRGIKIDNHDFSIVHNEAFNVLKNVYQISTEMVYAPVIGL
jgi:hypothetical protein